VQGHAWAKARVGEAGGDAGQRDRCSDLPELTETFWQNAVPNPFYRPVKKQITLRIDADILAWLRQQGPEGYQSRLNALLRSVMLRDLESKRKRA
jgi:uncharacterized protein (DUF4415 family)